MAPKVWEWWQLFVSVGLAAAITSGAGLIHDRIVAEQQRCSLSEQIVGDSTPNPTLSPIERQQIAARAGSRLQRCLGDTR
jgi:hypothetical protein